MDNDAFKSIKQGLTEALAHARGEAVAVALHQPGHVDVAVVREQLGLTQTQFAATFGFSVATLRHWEQGDRQPHGPARVLLNVIAREPQAVMRALVPGN